MEFHDIKNKVFLITGAADGIGALTVTKFLEEGAKHVAVLDIAEQQGNNLESKLKATYGDSKIKFHKCDVTNEENLNAAYEETIKQYNYIDCVVNNAGIMNDSQSLYKKEIEINMTALITSSLKAYHMMRKDNGGKGGTVINISSVAGLGPFYGKPIYCATKSAVLTFSKCLGMELNFSRTGVRVVCVCFGVTDTAIFNKTGSIDDVMENDTAKFISIEYKQRPNSAAEGVIEAFKNASSGSTWIATNDKVAFDITNDVTEGYKIISDYKEKQKYKKTLTT